jgi:N-acetylmuramic acid 6-phosphate etherase
MIEARPASEKLRRRAVRTVVELGGLAPGAARRALEAAGWSVRAVLDARPAPRRAAGAQQRRRT